MVTVVRAELTAGAGASEDGGIVSGTAIGRAPVGDGGRAGAVDAVDAAADGPFGIAGDANPPGRLARRWSLGSAAIERGIISGAGVTASGSGLAVGRGLGCVGVAAAALLRDEAGEAPPFAGDLLREKKPMLCTKCSLYARVEASTRCRLRKSVALLL